MIISRVEKIRCIGCSIDRINRVKVFQKKLICISCLRYLRFSGRNRLQLKSWEIGLLDEEWKELEELEYAPLPDNIIVHEFIQEDENGGIIFYVSDSPLGKGKNHGPEELLKHRLDISGDYEYRATGEFISGDELLKKYSNWHCNVCHSWDEGGSNL